MAGGVHRQDEGIKMASRRVTDAHILEDRAGESPMAYLAYPPPSTLALREPPPLLGVGVVGVEPAETAGRRTASQCGLPCPAILLREKDTST